MKTGRLDAAVSNLRRAARIEPLDASMHFALGMALQQQGSCGDSIVELSAALRLEPSMPHVQEQLAKCAEIPSAGAEREKSVAGIKVP